MKDYQDLDKANIHHHNLLHPSYGAQKILSGGYGWHMGFAANPNNYTTIFQRLSGAYELYGSKLKDPTIFYKKNETTPSKYPEDL